MSVVPSFEEMTRELHRIEHFVWRRTADPLPEGQMVGECWALDGEPPPEAIAAADRGEPGTRWCPILCPDLAP